VLDEAEVLITRKSADLEHAMLVHAVKTSMVTATPQEEDLSPSREMNRLLVCVVACDPSAVAEAAVAAAEVRVHLTLPRTPQARVAVLALLVDECAAGALRASESVLEQVAGLCHGFAAGDLAALVRAAVQYAGQQQQQRGDGETKGQLTPQHFHAARALVRPSVVYDTHSGSSSGSKGGMSPEDAEDVAAEPGEVKEERGGEVLAFSGIGGHARAKQEIREAVLWPLLHPELHAQFKLEDIHGILLYGPPGTGKTLLAKAVAAMLRINFLVLPVAEVMKSEVGASEKAIQAAFARAKSVAPCVMFIDEIESVFGSRESRGPLGRKLVGQLLLELDSSAGVLLLGATNHPEQMDASLLAPGRFDRLIYVPLPDERERAEILSIQGSGLAWGGGVTKVAQTIAARTSGFSGADLAQLCRQAGMHAAMRLRAAVDVKQAASQACVVSADFDLALDRFVPSVAPSMLARFQNFKNTHDHFSASLPS
jgi:SpoVK/Ycf46/Vps4 family AAA+-type ATPase